MIELVPESYVAVLDLEEIFGRRAPLHVDLGCGDGTFLSAMAAHFPEKNFLGIDRLTGRVAKSCRRATEQPNARVLHLETTYAVRYLFAEGSVETFYLLFPDPWPKRRHHRRRIFTSDFLDAVHRALAAGGTLRVATDQVDYFRQIIATSRADPRFAIADEVEVDLPKTKFERRFEAAGAPIYGLVLRKLSPVM